MRIELCKEDAESILNHPDIYKTVCDDGSPPELVIPEDWISIVAYEIDPMACFVLHKHNFITMECHVQILPEYRHKSEEISRSILDWVRDNSEVQKLIAWIPFDCENVKIFAEKMGFTLEGISEDSVMKGGQLYSEWLMGLRLWR